MKLYTLATPPQPVGFFVLWDGFKVGAYRHPSWLRRKAMQLAFGWKWEPAA